MGVGSVVLWIVALWPLPTRCLQLIPAPLNCEKQKYWRTWLCPQGGGIKNHWVRSTVWEINLKALCKKDWKFLCYRQRPVNQRPQMLWHIQQYAKQPPTTKNDLDKNVHIFKIEETVTEANTTYLYFALSPKWISMTERLPQQNGFFFLKNSYACFLTDLENWLKLGPGQPWAF